jgi:hypothetical protein
MRLPPVLVVGAFFPAMLPAQASVSEAEAEQARALAQAIEQDGDRDVVAVLPKAWRDQCLRFVGHLTEPELEVALAEASTATAGLAAAVAVLAGTRQAKDPAVQWLRMARAAHRVGLEAQMAQLERVLRRTDSPASAADAPAQRACRAGVAAILRDHAASREAQLACLLAAAWPEAWPALAAWAPKLATLPEQRDRLTFARALLQRGELPAARAVLDTIPGADAPQMLGSRELLDRDLRRLRERLRALEQLPEPVAGDETGGKLARLRRLQLTDRDAALAECRALVAADFAHSAPSTLLAIAAMNAGNQAELETHLDRALALPGADANTAILLLTVRLVALIEAAKRQEAGGEALLRELAAGHLRRADAIVGADNSEAGVMYRGLRALGWPLEREGLALLEDLPGLRALAQQLPESLSLHTLLLAAAMHRDDAAARQVLAAPPPAALATSPALQRTRAEVAVALAAQLPEPAAQRQFVEPFLVALAAAQNDPRDAHLLRGLLVWGGAAAMADPTAARQLAAAEFKAADRLPFDRGAWLLASSAWVAQLVAGAVPDAAEFARVREISDESGDPRTLVPVLAAYLLYGDPSGVKSAVKNLLGQLQGEPVGSYVLHSASAEVEARAGQREAARSAAKEALALREAVGQNLRFVEHGLLPLRQVGFRLTAWSSGPELLVSLRCDFMALPPLPDLGRLEQLARDD